VPRVALLTNFIAPYRVPLFEALRERVGQLRVFASTPIEPNRTWRSYRGELEVTIQRTITLRKRWRDAAGFTDIGYVHLPYDTLAQLRRFRPDVIISGELGLRTLLAAIYKRQHEGVRLVVWATVSEHTESGRGLLRSLIRPRLLRYADAVLVNGASGARYVTSLGVPHERVILAPYTTDIAAFETTRRVAAAPPVIRLLFAGMFVERKGLLPFLTVLRRWAEAHPDCRLQFDIAGNGPLRGQLAAFDGGAGLAVRVLDAVEYERLPDLFASADIFVLPTLADEWGVVVNEAMAAGLPVLGSRHSQAVEELVADDETGWTFTPENETSIFSALDRALLTCVETRQQMGTCARHRVRELTPDLVADRIATALCLSPQSS
jgi:glycosyltransferase involved in cell wall biosynthesis